MMTPGDQGLPLDMHRPAPANLSPFVLAVLAAGCSGQDRLDRPNLVLISIDTLRADHVGSYGYFRDTTPHIDRFAGGAVKFERCYATMATTLPSHASMLTGLYPIEHGILANLVHGGRLFGWSEQMVSFAQILRDDGYATAGFIGAAPLKSATGISLGFSHWSEPKGRERRAEEVIDEALPWLAEHAPERFFLFVHLYDPHWRHKPPEPWRSQFETDDELEEWIAARAIPEEAVRSQGVLVADTRFEINRYDGEIAYTDDQVGRLFEKMRELQLFRSTIVILTSDHGEGLNQHDWASHGLVWDEQLRVPLLIRFPGLMRSLPRRFEPTMSLIDLFPTVMGRMTDFDTPLAERFLEQATGVDVLAADFEERPVFSQRTGREVAEDPGAMYSLTGRDWKFIHEAEAGYMLFDRSADPHELENLVEVRPAMAEEAREKLRASMDEQAARGEPFATSESGPLDPAHLQELRELGYLGGTEDEDGPE